MKLSILITGSNGFIGKELAKKLSEKDRQIICVDLVGDSVKCDLTSQEEVHKDRQEHAYLREAMESAKDIDAINREEQSSRENATFDT